MKNLVFRLFMLLMLSSTILLSCKGPQGDPGKDGQDGQDGNANVISSNWITPTWVAASYYGSSGYKYDWTVNDLTQSVFDSGVILVYWKNWRGNVYLLPYNNGGSHQLYFTFNAHVGTISLWAYYLDGTALASAPHSTNKFRYVLIPQGTSSRPAGDVNTLREDLARQGVDIDNYYQVCEYYHLQP